MKAVASCEVSETDYPLT